MYLKLYFILNIVFKSVLLFMFICPDVFFFFKFVGLIFFYFFKFIFDINIFKNFKNKK